MADSELSAKLHRRDLLNNEEEVAEIPRRMAVFNPYTEFKEFTKGEIDGYKKMFQKYDVGNDKFIDFMELKIMMEKLDAAQTHLALKEMIREVDEDHDDKINFREFLLIFRKAKAGDLMQDSGLYALYQQLEEIDVDKEGVGGAKHFFEAKINKQTQDKKFENEILEEQALKKQKAEEDKARRKAFKEKSEFFVQAMNN